ncbi:MAG: AAA family ATPase [Chitinophagales bacterium]
MQNGISILDFLQFDCPTQEQKAALLAMAEFVKPENKDDFFILCGAAGTGKTSITTALIGYMNNREIDYKIAAPTNRAARIMAKKSKVLSNTIHSMIYTIENNAETGEVRYKLKTREMQEPHSCVFIIDEASMVNAKIAKQEESLFSAEDSLLNDLVKFIKQYHQDSKVVILGDRNQLPPVKEKESYALMPEYLERNFSWKGNSHILTQVKRADDGTCIMKNAIRTREAIERGQEAIALDAFKFKFGMGGAATHYAKAVEEQGYEQNISIGCTHESNKYFNNLVRKKLFGSECRLLEKGDYMLITQNWERNGVKLYNGDHVIVEDFNAEDVEMVTGLHFIPIKLKAKDTDGKYFFVEDYILLDSIGEPGGVFSIEKEKLLRRDRYAKNKIYRETENIQDDRYLGAIRLTYGHSITCNKAQGGEWKNVYVNTFFIPNLKWQYTAITRAQQNLLLY